MKEFLPFPDPPSRRHIRLSILCGLFAGIWILTLIVQSFKPTKELLPYSASPPLHFNGWEGTRTFPHQEATDLLIDAVIQLESQGNPNQVGSMGERGLMQLMEATWAEVTEKHFGQAISFDRAFEPELNRQVGRLYLGDLQVYLYQYRDQWKSDLRSLLLAAYNGGPKRLKDAGFDVDRLPRSVRSYAQRGSALHDWSLGEGSEEMLQRILDAGE